jgi:3-oxoacyl-[acyl-carrier protein] reductase
MMKALALELGPFGVRVNVVAPGLTNTDAVANLPEAARQASAKMSPLQRIGEPDDVAGAILMLACDEARFVTGSYVPVSGGALML